MSKNIFLALLVACTPVEPEPGSFSDCDPLDPSLCMLPFPSSFFLREADTPTGYRVQFGETTLPINRDNVRMNPRYWNEKDGFSISGPLLTWFADLSLDGVVGHPNLADYAAPDAKVVLVDTVTGERVPVWAEIDQTAEEDHERLFMIYPAAPLEYNRRYVVGLRNLKTTGGASVQRSEAFLALRDGVETESYDIEGRRDEFESIVFPALASAGVPRAELDLAWDFVTVSRENSLGRMEKIRDEGLAAIGPSGPAYTVTGTTEFDCSAGEKIAREVILEMTVPLYMDVDRPGAVLTRDAAGLPFVNGETKERMIVRIPCSVAQDPKPSFVLQYGHGLLGDYSEARTGWLSDMANRHGWIVVASSWTGMSTEDAPGIALAISEDPSNFITIPERSHQGFLNAMAALRLARGALAQDPALHFSNSDGQSVSVIDPNQYGYYGNSQGGILGGAYLAMSPDLQRGVLGVPGAPYSLLLLRSHDFEPFFQIFKAKFTDHRDIVAIIGLMQMVWDPAESVGWAYAMNRDVADGMLPKDVLLHAGILDSQVTTLGAHVMARAYGASTLAPETRPVFGLTEREPGFVGSAIVEWRYTNLPEEPIDNVPPPVGDSHECPRREPEGQAQIKDFLETGVVNQYCEGVCEGVTTGLCGG
jgi:hypothetical protein